MSWRCTSGWSNPRAASGFVFSTVVAVEEMNWTTLEAYGFSGPGTPLEITLAPTAD